MKPCREADKGKGSGKTVEAKAGHPEAEFNFRVRSPKPQALPATEKTYLFKELYIETIIRNPKKVGLSGPKDLGLKP